MYAGEAMVEVAALEEAPDGLVNNWAPVAELAGIAQRAAAGWERSIGVIETIREEPVMGSGGRPLKGVKRRIVTRRPCPGNPAFLTEMRGAMADMRRL